MSDFIFQSVPRRYNLSALARSATLPADGQRWKATRYRRQMRPNDGVFFYMSGRNAGIYGCGRIMALPDEDTRTVPVKWKALYQTPISRRSLQPLLSQNLLFTVRVGTNFLLSPKESSAVRRLVASKGLPLP